jgi:SAM-dependent methyltransferase
MSTAAAMGFRFACPCCGGPLSADGSDAWRCLTGGDRFARVRGVWRFLTEAQANAMRPFLCDYRQVRLGEGRGSTDPEYFRSLPFLDETDRFSEAWSIRAAGYRALARRVIDVEQKRLRRRLRVVDLGAGNGWLSNRLAALGHRVAAVDVFTDATDGLEASKHYENAFVPIEASFDSLPLESSSVDVAIFNASLHYAPNVEVPLIEALRVLRPSARLVILDTPIYRRPESGSRMVAEREADFLSRFGTKSDSLNAEHFLTMPRLHDLSAKLGVAWRFFTPNYGLRWFLEPWRARLRGRREPARFRIVTAVAPPKWEHAADPRRPAVATHASDVVPIEMD